jgi:hypothetical protein
MVEKLTTSVSGYERKARGTLPRMRPSLGCHFGRLVSTPEIGRHLLKVSSGMQ